MPKAKHGDTVRVHYVGRLSDGTIFERTDNDDLLEFTIGADEVLPKFEQTVIGLEVGSKKIIEVSIEEGYGDYDEDQIYEIAAHHLPEDLEPEIGMTLEITMPSGRSEAMTVIDIEEEAIILDANHPLAGEDLIFEIRLVEIVDSGDE